MACDQVGGLAIGPRWTSRRSYAAGGATTQAPVPACRRLRSPSPRSGTASGTPSPMPHPRTRQPAARPGWAGHRRRSPRRRDGGARPAPRRVYRRQRVAGHCLARREQATRRRAHSVAASTSSAIPTFLAEAPVAHAVAPQGVPGCGGVDMASTEHGQQGVIAAATSTATAVAMSGGLPSVRRTLFPRRRAWCPAEPHRA